MRNLLLIIQHRWIGVRIDLLGCMFTAIVAFWLVYGGVTSPGGIGFTLFLISGFSSMLLSWVRIYNQLEVQANR